MSRIFLASVLFFGFFAESLSADECSESTLDSEVQVSLEGRFVNRDFFPVHLSLAWIHVPGSADTFDIVLSGKESFRYVSSKDFRYMEFRKEKARRQMARHHLQEFIGESPLTWNHLESLARGNLPCEDSAGPDTIAVHSRKDYDGILLPAIIDFSGKGGRGSLWVRTARKIFRYIPEHESDFPSILWHGVDSKSKIPLILQMD